MLFQAYHGVSAAQHQANFNKWSAEGYRMISLSVYGDAGNALYAAVWVQRSGPAWVAIHGVDAAGYQSFFTKWSDEGYYPVLVSATGAADDAVFASVFEQGNPGVWAGRHGMTPADFAAASASALANGQVLRSFSIYGTSADRRYAAIWHPNPTFVKSTLNAAETASAYQTTFNAAIQLPGVYLNAWRPAYVALSGDGTYCSVFKDDFVGPWAARHGLSGSDYQAFFNQQVAEGYYPIVVQGGGTTAAPIYAAIFAKQDVPYARKWTVTGSPVAALAPVDQAVRTFMQANGVRAAQVAIAKNGTMRSSRGYTWAEPGYRLTHPTDRFLLASCSKMFCEAAIQSLYNSGKLHPPTLTVKPAGTEKPVVGDTVTGNKTGATAVVTAVNGDTLTLASVLNTFTTADTAATMSNSGGTVAVLAYRPGTKVYPLLGFSHPADPRSDSITVQQLLDHQGGYDDGRNPKYPYAPDPTYNMRQIGQALGHAVATKLDVATYMYGQRLQFAPGTDSAYSNYGYLLLGAVVEKVTGMSYHAYLAQAVLQPAGITEVEVFPTRAAGRTAQQAIAEDPGLGLDPLDLASALYIPCVYGGDGEINEVGDPNDGTGASAQAMARLVHTHAVWGNGGRAAGYARAGSTPGASTWAESRWDGIDWAYAVNTRTWPPASGQTPATTAKGSQALTTAAFTLTVANGGTAGFQPSGHLLVDTISNGTQLVAYTGINVAASTFTGCTARANAGAAGDGATVKQACTVAGAPALTQTPFTINVSKNGTLGFARTGMLAVTNTANTAQVIRYTGLGTDAFEGCTALLPGAGSAAAGALVTQASLESSIDTLLGSIALP
ncbi:MAG TPA: serine hydrolase [Streptosporangiaceae bacterium]|nr:serine hydrolase [Streptosporangiaceae bacterium]